MPKSVTLENGATIGGGGVFVIAEAGVNHNGSLERALEMVAAAAAAGADAVKFQSFRAEELVSRNAPKAQYQSEATGPGSQFDMLKALELSQAGHEALFARAMQRRIMFLSTPFEERSADMLAELGVAAFKLPSGEITNLPFLRHVARKGRPLLVSTGMADIGEVAEAVAAIEKEGNAGLVLLHCVSRYPAQAHEVNLRAMATMRDAFGCPVGFSDHTEGTAVSIAAAALGAAVIEKHFTLDRRLPGPDHAASLEPGELAAMIAGIRAATAALGDGRKRMQPAEREVAAVARKSLVVTMPIASGQRIGREQIAARRPGTGISPAFLDQVAGRCAARPLSPDTPLQWSDLA